MNTLDRCEIAVRPSIPFIQLHPEAINLAAFKIGTHSLGPGRRAAFWVQGCPFHCKGCFAPEWIVNKQNMIAPVHELAEMVFADPSISGITISGGEPMLQAGALRNLISLIRSKRYINVICFTGFRYEALLTLPQFDQQRQLMANLDVLIDGPYIEERNDNRGLRGSNNQRIIHLTDQLRAYPFENIARKLEIMVENGNIFTVGVPPTGYLGAVDSALDSIVDLPREGTGYEWS